MDYEYLPTCEYEIAGYPYPADCGEPAVARVWWKGEDVDAMLVCQKHLKEIMSTEEGNDD